MQDDGYEPKSLDWISRVKQLVKEPKECISDYKC